MERGVTDLAQWNRLAPQRWAGANGEMRMDALSTYAMTAGSRGRDRVACPMWLHFRIFLDRK